MKAKAFGYLRVSDSSQAKDRKDGFPRQERAVRDFAKANGIEIAAIFRDEVSGTKDEAARPAFQEMMTEILRDGVKTVILERLDRLAREYRVQESLLIYLASKDVQVINAATEENVTAAIQGDPMKKALIQVQGIFAELEKNQLVRKLRAARDRKRAQDGKCEGRKGYLESEEGLHALEEIKRLRRKPKKGRRLSCREIAERLNERGVTTLSGGKWTANNVNQLLFQLTRNRNRRTEDQKE